MFHGPADNEVLELRTTKCLVWSHSNVCSRDVDSDRQKKIRSLWNVDM